MRRGVWGHLLDAVVERLVPALRVVRGIMVNIAFKKAGHDRTALEKGRKLFR